MKLHRPYAGGEISLTPDEAGWTWCGLSVLRLTAGESRTVRTDESEVFALPLSGGLSVDVDGEAFLLHGRPSVFAGASDFLYAGRDSTLTLTSRDGAEVALPAARCEHRRTPAYGSAADVPIEVRGAGPSTRQVRNFGIPGGWEHAEKLIACEVITPPGNWSSYPPHKHDPSEGSVAVDEEIYYYRIAGPDQRTPSRDGFGLHRTYTDTTHHAAGLAALDETFEVRDGDILLIPHGYHGPCVAAPGYPMYYLNVLAGPGEERSMNFCDDPTHAWIRDSWTGQAPDPRAVP